VYDGYGCQEIIGIAFQCREQQGYHVVEPNLVIETDSFIGDTKELVITDLWNYSWPLIRYKNGDLVSGEKKQCRCGCTWETISDIIGRTADLITTPEGGILHYGVWEHTDILNSFSLIRQVQLVKVAPSKVVLRIQFHEKPERAYLDKIRDSLSPYLKNIMEFDVVEVDGFEVGSSGKHQLVVDKTV
jgi:phenylacetate-CoA ligase